METKTTSKMDLRMKINLKSQERFYDGNLGCVVHKVKGMRDLSSLFFRELADTIDYVKDSAINVYPDFGVRIEIDDDTSYYDTYSNEPINNVGVDIHAIANYIRQKAASTPICGVTLERKMSFNLTSDSVDESDNVWKSKNNEIQLTDVLYSYHKLIEAIMFVIASISKLSPSSAIDSDIMITQVDTTRKDAEITSIVQIIKGTYRVKSESGQVRVINNGNNSAIEFQISRININDL